MKGKEGNSADNLSPSDQIDAIIRNAGGWKGKLLSELRDIIRQSEPGIVEEVKWKEPSRPEGVPVWSLNGIICVADVLKNAVRLTFPKGAGIPDGKKLFNTRLDSRTVRAVDFHEGDTIDGEALKGIITDAVRINESEG